jgi:hypothetical protein
LSVAAAIEAVSAVGFAGAGRDRAGPAHLGEGGLGPDPGLVVAGSDQHLSGDVEADADGLEQLRCRRLGLGLEVVAVDLDLLVQV